ncbi:hypothetical protein PA01_12880 [Azoarcus sp. PA01]|nr:hypothetical protein PA01_12880 [Azoarcus sp. PA01]
MPFISLNTAVSLTGLSKRTLWRRIADGVLHAEQAGEPGEQTRVGVDDLLPLSPLQLEPDDRALILEADGGNPEAQCDLALLFLAQEQPAEAVRWLQASAAQFYPEGMHWLGRCCISGTGTAPNEQTGTAWIAKAARHGHARAGHMIRYLQDPARPSQTPAALEARLDTIEREIVLKVLEDTASRA